MTLQLTRRYVSWYFLIVDIPLGMFLIYIDMCFGEAMVYPDSQHTTGQAGASIVWSDPVGFFIDFLLPVLILIFINLGFLLMIGYACNIFGSWSSLKDELWRNRFWKCSVTYNVLILIGNAVMLLTMLLPNMMVVDIYSFTANLISTLVMLGVPGLGVYLSRQCIFSAEKVRIP